jgi:hypothetical protein
MTALPCWQRRFNFLCCISCAARVQQALLPFADRLWAPVVHLAVVMIDHADAAIAALLGDRPGLVAVRAGRARQDLHPAGGFGLALAGREIPVAHRLAVAEAGVQPIDIAWLELPQSQALRCELRTGGLCHDHRQSRRYRDQHDLPPKTGSHFSGSCSNLAATGSAFPASCCSRGSARCPKLRSHDTGRCA